MKKFLLFYVALFISAATFSQQQFPNASFENWYVQTTVNPTDYNSANLEGFTIEKSVFRSSDAISGQYSLGLETFYNAIKDEFNFGYIINFDPDQFTGGVPFDFHATMVNGYYKAGIQAQDTALVLVMLMKDGANVGGNIYTITVGENTDTWTKFMFPTFLEDGVNPDTVLIGITSSNALAEAGIAEGSWLMIDSLYFSDNDGNIQMADNGDFENWDIYESEFPEDFYTTQLFASPIDPIVVEKVSPGSDGDYAIKLNVVWNQYNDVITGVVTNGDISQSFPFTPVPFSDQPLMLTYDFQNQMSVESDPATVFINFYKDGVIMVGDSRDYLDNTDGYESDTMAFNFPEAPDSMLFIATVGQTVGDWFILDNLKFHYLVGTSEGIEILQTVAYPNPATNHLNFNISVRSGALIEVQIINLTGKVVLKGNWEVVSGNNTKTLDISFLSKGSYLYSFRMGNAVFTKSFIKQ